MLTCCSKETCRPISISQGKVQRMRPSPFHKGSGEAPAPAAAKKPVGRSRKVVSDVRS